MSKKVPYLQYEILEFIHKGNDISAISSLCGYPAKSKIIGSAIDSLAKKQLLSANKRLTDEAIRLLNRHYKDRHIHKQYMKSDYSLSLDDTLFDITLNPYHRWYEYLEDFPADFVRKYAENYKLSEKYYLFDPFLGSGTTLISGKMAGLKGIGFDINPVMTFIAKQKLNWNYDTTIFQQEYDKLISWFIKNNSAANYLLQTPLGNMPKKELNQWLSPVKQREVACLYWYITNQLIKEYQNLFLLILLSSAIRSSYVAFCPGTTFYPFRPKPDLIMEFCNLAKDVLKDLSSEYQKNKAIESKVYLASSTELTHFKAITGQVDLIITSPPYPNDLEYTRQTRLEMYLLGYASKMEDVQKIKKNMVKGSTKLIYHCDKPISAIVTNKKIQKIAKAIYCKTSGKNWGFDYPLMVQMYFSNMYQCLKNYYSTLVVGGTTILVVGDQTIQGVLVPVSEILADLSKEIGFTKTSIELHRTRRSTAHDIPIPEENLIITK